MLSHFISYPWILRHTDAPAALPLYLSGPRWTADIHNPQTQGQRSILAATFLSISAENGNPFSARLEQKRELVHTALMLPSQETASSALPKHTLGQFACQYNTAGSVQQHPQSIAWLTWHRLSTRHKCRQDNLCTLSPITSPVFSFCLAFLITLTHCPEQIQLPS